MIQDCATALQPGQEEQNSVSIIIIIIDINYILEQMYLTDNYRTFYPTTAEYTFSSATHRMFSKIDHI